MANPRLFLKYDNITGVEIPVALDAGINLPAFANGANLSVSTDIYAAVTNKTTSTYAAPADNLTVGKGAANDPLFGQLVTAESDGFGVVQFKGVVRFKVNQANPPALNQFVAVDGTGRVQAAGLNAQFSNAVCIGFVSDDNDTSFTHLQGTLSVPTSAAAAPKVCLVKLA